MSFAGGLMVAAVVGCSILMIWHHWPTPSHVKPTLGSYYDYVIVGGGTAGCVLARRLTEDPDIKVALLEAGDEEIDFMMRDIPHAALEMQKTSADWAYQTVPQNNSCLGLREKKSNWPRGKVLGGSSTIGLMSYTRGNRLDYNAWEEMGAKGWAYEDVLPYFKKAEKNKNPEFARSEFHGTRGPLTITDSQATPKVTTAFKRAARELGYKVDDVNGADQLVVNVNQMTVDHGTRMSSASAYLRPVIKRKNLHVATEALATKILFKGTRAVGVQYIRNNTLHEVHVKREVILSAGTVASPQLLMLSGVGPKQHLEEMGIPVISDLPVGDNLQDQVMTDGMVYTMEDIVAITRKKAKGFLPLLDFIVFGAGLLSSTGIEGVGFFRSQAQPQSEEVPYLQLLLWPMLLYQDDEIVKESFLKIFNHERKYFTEVHGGLGGREGLMLLPVLLHPKSNGTIRLASTDPATPPIINPNYLSEKQDVDILLDGIRLSQALMETSAFRHLITQYHHKVHPACQEHAFDSDTYWRCYIQHNTLTAYNPVGTCRMGAADDAASVVTPDLKVKGVTHLRVVDASVIPQSLSGGTLAATVMIAEKAADAILDRDSINEPSEEEIWQKHQHLHHGEL